MGTSGALQQDVPLDSHLVSESAIGLDTLMYFYELQQSDWENKILDKLCEQASLPFRPYMASAPASMIAQFGEGMVKGNTVTCPGFYAPQGRKVRLGLKLPKLIENLNYFHEDGFWLTNFEMETAGYYAMAQLLGHDMLSVNAIIANRIDNKFSKNAGKVVDSLIKKVLDRI